MYPYCLPYAGPDSLEDGVATYRIGADFCYDRNNSFLNDDFDDDDFENDIAEYVIGCDVVTDVIGRPFPPPDRRWYKDGVLVYQLPALELRNPTPQVMDNDEFNARFPLLTPSGNDADNILILNDDGSISLSFINIAFSGRDFDVDEALNQLSGNWTCSVNNSMGTETATTIFGECGKLELPTIKINYTVITGA